MTVKKFCTPDVISDFVNVTHNKKNSGGCFMAGIINFCTSKEIEDWEKCMKKGNKSCLNSEDGESLCGSKVINILRKDLNTEKECNSNQYGVSCLLSLKPEKECTPDAIKNMFSDSLDDNGKVMAKRCRG